MFNDKVKGRIEWSNDELDDLVMVRSDGYPTYNFAVVVDDIDMQCRRSHSRRRSRQQHAASDQHLQRARREAIPEFAHLPMILGSGRTETCRSVTARSSVTQYRDDGFLPHALLNYSGAARLVARRSGNFLGEGDDGFVRRQQRQQSGRAFRSGKTELAQPTLFEERQARRNRAASRIPVASSKAFDHDARTGTRVDVVIALRERAQTLKEMAEKASVWYGPITQWDDAAINKHLKSA